MSDGKMRIGLWWHAQGTATSGLIFTDQFLRIMSEIPETAPQHENHLLYSTSYVRYVRYASRQIELGTLKSGEARFSLETQPHEVSDVSGVIPEVREIGSNISSGWVYDPLRHFLRVRHRGTELVIRLETARVS
jgi:hypothetical protein